MKLSVFSPVLADRSLEEACKTLHDNGVRWMEMGCGGYPGKAHCDPEQLLADPKKLDAFKATLKKYDIQLSALSVHGNPVHPDRATAEGYQKDFEQAVLLAQKLGITRIIGFSGCPGGSAQDKMPNWVTCSWPPDYMAILDYQWNQVLIPYWKKTAAWAAEHGIQKIAFEMHPGFCVYNPETLLRLRREVGPIIGANLDPSHLFWQGIDPVAAIRALGEAIYFFHAKDTKINPYTCAVNGVLDVRHYGDEASRSWIFRTVGYGHDYGVWKDIISTLRMAGYDDVISIEHEDSLMSQMEGLKKAISFMNEVLVFEDKGAMYWA
jgi:sugar phosphate isomerase/epimerase